jgi:Holliday junction resolvase YEN1
MSTPVEPVFVFDGPDKPTFKRNKRAGRGDTATISQAKQLIRLLGFPIHDAPGEAEADCALLQQRGVVDAVLSEDVDTIMFGCTRTLRSWTAESKTAKTPTHVTQYDVTTMDLAGKGLDREGMVLVALMSGGDYLPDGIPQCGVKVACEAAKAGYGRSLCKIKASDKQALADWRDSLIHELKTNESQFFRVKHSALSQKVPREFPNIEVLRYYTHPVVSPTSAVQALKERMAHYEQRPLRLHDLREFARTVFGWDYRIGAVKFIRVLGAALLTRQLLLGDEEHIERVAGSRKHSTTDGQKELRLRFTPENVVPVDLTEEIDEYIPQSRESLALNSDDELDAPGDEITSSQPTAKLFDVSKPDLAWVLEDLVKQTAPFAYRDWQEAERVKALRKSPKKRATAKGAAKTAITTGAMDKFVRITKTSNPPVDPSMRDRAKAQSLAGAESLPPAPWPRT